MWYKAYFISSIKSYHTIFSTNFDVYAIKLWYNCTINEIALYQHNQTYISYIFTRFYCIISFQQITFYVLDRHLHLPWKFRIFLLYLLILLFHSHPKDITIQNMKIVIVSAIFYSSTLYLWMNFVKLQKNKCISRHITEINIRFFWYLFMTHLQIDWIMQMSSDA